jgi:hypothetical protein
MTRTLIDPKFRNFIREKPCIVAVALDRVDECSNVVEACHNKHSGMGGKNVPDVGNLFSACMKHHGESHTIGQKTYRKKYDLDVDGTCVILAAEYELGVCFPAEPWGVKVSYL